MENAEQLEELVAQALASFGEGADPSDDEIIAKVRELLEALPDEANGALGQQLDGAIEGEAPPAPVPEVEGPEEPPTEPEVPEAEEEPPAEEPKEPEPKEEKPKESNALAKRVAEMGRF
jgi:outer membrane biosynthesis protein TonB